VPHDGVGERPDPRAPPALERLEQDLVRDQGGNVRGEQGDDGVWY
jgi:hypothetical protein